jgi:hypothetical protein
VIKRRDETTILNDVDPGLAGQGDLIASGRKILDRKQTSVGRIGSRLPSGGSA